MPVKRLPPNPSLDHLNTKQRLLKGHAYAIQASSGLREFHPRSLNAADPEIFAASLKLSDALLAIAREHGFQLGRTQVSYRETHARQSTGPAPP